MNVATDIERAHELVVVGSRWFGWGHHWTVVDERDPWGVRQVRLVRDVRGPAGMRPGTRRSRAPHEWVDAWRVQKFCDRTETHE